ncbi:MAG: type IV pilus secretin PilQ [Thermodesulfobacteriota bacterium]
MCSHDAKATGIRLIFMVVGIFLMVAGCATLSPEQEQDSDISMITGVEAESKDTAGTVQLQSSGEMDYTSVKQYDPTGVIFYFPKTRLGDIDTGYTPGKGLIKSVDLSSSEDQQNVRMEIRLARDMPYKVDKDDNKFEIKFDERAESAISREDATGAVTDEPSGTGSEGEDESGEVEISEDKGRQQETSRTQQDQETGAEKKQPEKYEGLAVIEDIEFEALESGKSQIILGTTRPIEYSIERTGDRRLKMSLPDAALPEHMDRRPFITTRFDSAVDRIIPYEAATDKDAVEIIIELREDVPYRVEREDGRLIVNVEASEMGPRPYSEAELPDWRQVLEEEISRTDEKEQKEAERTDEEESDEPKTPSEEEAAAKEVEWLFEKDEYTGEKVALDFYETDIRNVFRILQQISGKNYAIDPDVQGKVTITMEKPVPWDQVLDLVMEQNGLGKVEKGDMVRIATKQTLRQEEQERRERIEAYRERKEQQKSMEPLITEYIPINYANAQNEVVTHVEDILSDRGKVNVDTRNNQLILTDTLDRIEKAREVISEIDKVTPQVVIEARIVEINEDYLKDIGSEFNMAREDISSSTLSGEYGHTLSMNNSAQSTNTMGFQFDNIGTPFTLDATLSALEEQDNVKIVSSPKIATLDNKKATITQGFEYPYQTVEDDDVNIEFKDIDLTLEVTPQVTPDERIALKIYVTKNDIAEQTQEAPALSTNEAETELLVEDGSTIVIGGIKKDTTNERVVGFPVLKDIPMLGWFFKRQFTQNEKSELLIFMTPRIVQLEQRNLAAGSDD